jgi:protein-disulfide isomerase
MSEKLSLPISIIVAGLLIGGGIYLNGRMSRDNPTIEQRQAKVQEANSESLKTAMRPIDANDHILGNPKARVLVVEYSDTECPFCKIFHKTMISVMQEFGGDGDVAWVYRHFPIAELHSRALKEAEALECASEIGGNSKFWEYANMLYDTTPSNNELDPKELPKIAVKVGLSSDTFNTCLNSGEFGPKVNADIQNAKEIGASGTPFSVLVDTKTGEHYLIEGAYPFQQIKSVIELILQS